VTEPAGPGMRGLIPGPGDAVLVDDTIVPGLPFLHWFRVLGVEESSGGRLRLTGHLLARTDRGEHGQSQPFSVTVTEPADLIVQRGPITAPAPADQRVGGPVGELLALARPGPPLPAAVEDALRRPDEHREGQSGPPRWLPSSANRR
jgi:hypothetical protein